MPTDELATPVESGRRERKRQQLHDALVAAAIELSLEQGWEATSVEQIADRVDVSARTFHRYFPSKDDVLFADNVAARQRFAVALAARPAAEDLMTAMCEASATFAVDLDRPTHEQARAVIIESSERLVATNLRHVEDWCAVAAEFAAGRLGTKPDDLLPQLVGRCAVVAMTIARRRQRGATADEIAGEIRACFAIIANFAAATSASGPHASNETDRRTP